MCGREEQKTIELSGPANAHLTERMEFSNEEGKKKKPAHLNGSGTDFHFLSCGTALHNQYVKAKVKDKQFIHRDLPDLIIQCV